MLDDRHSLAMAVRRAYKTMHRRADSFFAKHGVTADQYVLLLLLAQESEVTQENLVARASSDPNTVRRMLLLLEGQGLVIRAAPDRRTSSLRELDQQRAKDLRATVASRRAISAATGWAI